MGYIYKITNLINQKMYIGQTTKNPEVRWKQHQYAAENTEVVKHYPLYAAINKYGIKNFIFEVIEQTEDLVAREIYWIDFYKTYGTGYNATVGGEGNSSITTEEVKEIINLYNKGFDCKQIAIQINRDRGAIARILHQNNIVVKTRNEYCSKAVSQYSKKGTFIQSFSSLGSAAKWCIDNNLIKGGGDKYYGGHIGDVCSGKRKTACGFIWKYKVNNDNNLI